MRSYDVTGLSQDEINNILSLYRAAIIDRNEAREALGLPPARPLPPPRNPGLSSNAKRRRKWL